MPDIRPKTIITDLDGTLIRHHGDICKQHLIPAELLPNAKETLIDWDRKGYKIIIISGRRESVRAATEKQLSDAGIFYDQLLLSATGGQRILLNDSKIGSDEETAIGITVERNKGLEGIKT